MRLEVVHEQLRAASEHAVPALIVALAQDLDGICWSMSDLVAMMETSRTQ